MERGQNTLCDEGLKQAFLREENIPFLETIIQKEAQRLGEITQRKATVSYPKQSLSAAEFLNLQKRIKKRIQDFVNYVPEKDCSMSYQKNRNPWGAYAGLGTVVGTAIGIGSPVIPLVALGLIAGYGIHVIAKKSSFYNPRKERAIILADCQENVTRDITHEYTHHLLWQRFNKEETAFSRAFQEGVARGVELQISEEEAITQNNPLFLEKGTRKKLRDLTLGYREICKHFKRTPERDVLKQGGVTIRERFNAWLNPKAEGYIKGTTLFCIAEEQHGPQIYAKTLQKNFDFI